MVAMAPPWLRTIARTANEREGKRGDAVLMKSSGGRAEIVGRERERIFWLESERVRESEGREWWPTADL